MTPVVRIGIDTQTNNPVTISQSARTISTYVIGIQGMGKTTILQRIALGDIDNGDGLCFLDPHGTAVDEILDNIPSDREKDVIFWDIADTDYPFGINPFLCEDRRQISIRADAFVTSLENLPEFTEAFRQANRMREILRNLAITFLARQDFTLVEAPLFLEEPSFRKQFYDALLPDYPQIRRFWERYDRRDGMVQQEQFDASLNKLRRFSDEPTMRGIFGQLKTSINFRTAMDNGKIILVKLSHIGEGNAEVIGAFIVSELVRAFFQRIPTRRSLMQGLVFLATGSKAQTLRPFHIITDEFHRFMSSAIPTLHEEGRKAGVDVTFAHQNRDQIEDSRIKGSVLAVGNKIVFRVSGKDATELAKEFRREIPLPAVIAQRPSYHITPHALQHLATHPHENPEVNDFYNQLKEELDFFEQEALKWISIVENFRNKSTLGFMTWASSRGLNYYNDPPATANAIALARERFEAKINVLIYQSLQHKTREAFEAWWFATPDNPRWENLIRGMTDMLTIAFPQFGAKAGLVLLRNLHNLGSEERARFAIDTILEPKCDEKTAEFLTLRILSGESLTYTGLADTGLPHPDTPEEFFFKLDYATFFWDRGFAWGDWGHGVRMLVIEIILRLIEQPIYAQTGQITPVIERPETYANIEGGIANTLTNLPQYIARCTIQSEEASITTVPLPPATKESLDRAERIREDSVRLYAEDSRRVNAALQARSPYTPTPSKTLSRKSSASSVTPEPPKTQPYSDDYDDEGPISSNE